MVSMSIGEFIKEAYLVSLEMTLDEAAHKCGTSAGQLSKLINGKQSLTVDMALKLEKGFGRSADSWFNIYISNEISKARAAK